MRQSTLRALGLDDGHFLLNPLIAEALGTEKAFRSGEWKKAISEWDSERLTDNNLDFPDGTAITGTLQVTIEVIDNPILSVTR